jgi:hypothetical protein
MASVIEICNRALGRIGIDQLIESLDDPNNRARNCKLQYEPCRDEVMQDFPWNFAQTCIALSLVADVEVPGWRYAYRYPANALKVHRVSDEAGIRISSVNGVSWEVCNYDMLLPIKTPFMVMADPVTDGGKLVVSDVEFAYAWYTTKVTDPSQFSPLFRSALGWRMAMELALSTKASVPLYNNASSQYGWAVSQAQVGSLNEEASDPEAQSGSVMARY